MVVERPKAQKVGPELFEVQSFTDPKTYYVVDLLEQTCTCPNFKYRGVRCKHLELVYVALWRERSDYHS